MKLKYEGRDTSSGTVPSKLCLDEARLVADLRALMREYGLTRIEVEEANLEPRADRVEAEATAWKERAERAEADIRRLLDEQKRDLADVNRFRALARKHQGERDDAWILLEEAYGRLFCTPACRRSAVPPLPCTCGIGVWRAKVSILLRCEP